MSCHRTPWLDYHVSRHRCCIQVPSGTLYIALYNPVSAPYAIGYAVSARTSPHCISSCSGHGACGEDGRCGCQDGFTGPDCSVDVEALQKQGCEEGSLRQAGLAVAGGRAFSVCVCSAPAHCEYTAVADASALMQVIWVSTRSSGLH